MQVTPIEQQTPVELVRSLFADVLDRRDASAMVPYWHADVEEELPTGTVRGREEVRGYFAALFDAIPDFHIEATHVVGEGETVFVAWRVTGTFTGRRWMGIDPTGHRVELHGVDRFTVRDGKVLHNFVVYDQLSFARQLGMLPQAGSTADRAMLAGFNARTRVQRLLSRSR